MTSNKEMTKAYRNFFRETDPGLEFIKSLEDMIASEHTKAESSDNRTTSYSHTQRAKGIRLTIQKINSLCSEAKKGKPSE